MFRHKGKRRTFIHNLHLSIVFAFIAGIVNICGVLSINTLTTNVTGHFAFFSEKFIDNQYATSIVFLFFILSFLLGSFVSSLLIELVSRSKPRCSYTSPIVLEVFILSSICFYDYKFTTSEVNFIACILLLAMGIQNSLVTRISKAKVRTTHLTGLFTDLGIELSQLFFYNKKSPGRKTLYRNIFLRFIIITFFFLGCVLGGYSYNKVGLKTLLLASCCLLLTLFYDSIRYNFIWKRTMR